MPYLRSCMITLPLTPMKALMGSLLRDKDLIAFVWDTFIETHYQLYLPLVVCITRASTGMFTIYLIDMIGWCVVGNEVCVRMELRDNPFGKSYYLDFTTGYALTYKHPNPGIGIRHIQPENFLLDELWLPKTILGNDYHSAYTKWVIDYLGCLVALSNISVYGYYPLHIEGSLGHYYQGVELRSLQERLVSSIKTLIDNHPYRYTPYDPTTPP